MIEKKCYKIEIAGATAMSVAKSVIGLLIDYRYKQLLKQDYGDFWMDDILIKEINHKWETKENMLGYNVFIYVEIRENFKTKKLLKQVEERLEIGL